MQEFLMWPFSNNTERLNKIIAQQEAILDIIETRFAETETLLYDLLLRSGHAVKIRIIPTGENVMADKILFNIILPPKAAPDVIEREVVIKIGDVETQLNIPGDQTLIEAYEGTQNALVTVSLIDIDDAYNRSPETVASIELLDTFPPPAPGQIGLEIFDEKFAAADEEDTVLVEDTSTDGIPLPTDTGANGSVG